MLNYVRHHMFAKLAAMATLLVLSLLIFGCGDDEPETTPQPAPTAAPVDISPINQPDQPA